MNIALHHPKDIRVILGVADSFAQSIECPESDTRGFPVIELHEINGELRGLSILPFPGVGGSASTVSSISLTEALALAALIRKSSARRVFEFGTYHGVSTSQMALNLPEGGVIYTLDLHDENSGCELPIPDAMEQRIASEKGKGTLIPEDLMGKVIFLREDSAKFDPTPYRGTMDMVFVDGAHSHDYVKNDTEKGFEMLRPGGIMAWHDCSPRHRDLVRYLKTQNPPPWLVRGTSLAFSVKRH